MDVAGRTMLPGLIDAHDHLASHGYGLATRFGLDEPASTAHLRTARVLAETLAMGYTTVRDAGGLDSGFKLAVEQGLIPGPRLVLAIQIISPTGGIGDRVSPSGHGCCCAVFDPLLPNSRRQWPGRRARRGADHGRAPAPTSSRRPPPAAPARARGTGPRTRRSRSRRCRRWSPSPTPSGAA